MSETCVICGSDKNPTHAYVGAEDEHGVPCLDICDNCMGIARKTALLMGVDLDKVDTINANNMNVAECIDVVHFAADQVCLDEKH